MPLGASLPRGLCLLVVLVFLGLVGTAGNAAAACTIPSTLAGASIALTSVGQTVAICITNDQAKWGLYPALNVQSNFNAPIGNTTGTVDVSLYSYADYTYTTSKAVYLLHPVQGSASLGADEVDVTLVSQSGSGTDSINLYSSSFCTNSGSCSGPQATRTSDGQMFASGPTDTLFLLAVTSLPLPPTVTAVAPASGPAAGGTSVTITGTGFDTTAANNTVKFGTSPATIVGTPTATSIVATTPAHAAGAVDVTRDHRGRHLADLGWRTSSPMWLRRRSRRSRRRRGRVPAARR